MKRKTIKYLNDILLNKRHLINNTNSHQYINQIPKNNQQTPLQTGSKEYVENQLEILSFNRLTEEQTTSKNQFQQKWKQQIKEIQKLKIYQLAKVIQRLNKNFSYGQIQQARQILIGMNFQQKKELRSTLEMFQLFLKANVKNKKEVFQSHTIIAAENLIQELKKVKKMDQL